MSDSARTGTRERASRRRILLTATGPLALLVLCKLSLHLLTSDNYGYFRDEVYTFPTLVIVTAFTRLLLGDSLLAVVSYPLWPERLSWLARV